MTIARPEGVDPGSLIAFIGSYGPPTEDGIHVIEVDPSLGPTRIGGVGGIENPSFLVTHPKLPLLYSVSEVGLASAGTHGSVHVLETVEVHGRVDLVPHGLLSTMGDHPCHIGIDPAGEWMVVSNYGSGDVVVFRLTDDGRLAERTSSTRHTGSGPDGTRQAGPHPHSAAFSPDGAFAVVADLGIDQVVTYALDRGEGRLIRHDVRHADPGAGPRTSAFHPDGGFLCTVNELANTVTSWAWDDRAGTLQRIRTVPTLPADVGNGGLAADLRFSPSGDRLHVSNRGHDSIATFSFDRTGEPRLLDTTPSGGRWPRAIDIDPSGAAIMVANEHSDEVVVLPSSDDLVSPSGSLRSSIRIPRPSSIAFARSGPERMADD